MTSVAVASLLLSGVVACRGPSTDAPADTYKTFVAALNQGDGPTAWALLSHDTQAELTKQSQAVAKARGLAEPPEPWRTAFGEAYMSHREIKSVTSRPTLAITPRYGSRTTKVASRPSRRSAKATGG